MTNREFLNAVANNESVEVEIREYAISQIEKLDKKNMSRSSKPSKARLQNESLANEMITKMEVGKVYTAGDLAVLMDLKAESGAISTSKATAVVKILVEQGKVKADTQKVPKKGSCKVYWVE